MKALSVRQPWTSLIADGVKGIELRTWTTRYRGPLLICASAAIDAPWRQRNAIWYREHKARLPLGVTVCVVDLVDVRPATAADEELACGPVAAGEFAWILGQTRACPRRALSGRLGLFDVPDHEIWSAGVGVAPPTSTGAPSRVLVPTRGLSVAG